VRAVLQRVSRASVVVEGRETGAIGPGLLALVAVAPSDGLDQIAWMAAKIAQLRIFPDNEGKMNRSLLEAGFGALLVSQFTLYADVRKGRRPSFIGAAPGDVAAPRFDALVAAVRDLGVAPVGTGVFGAHMDVSLVNDGPVTIVVDTP
jgi:D-tyrosyl-tRNA(Tyr) deacylase